LKPKRRLVSVSDAFDPKYYLLAQLTHPSAAVRYGACYGISRFSDDPRVRLALKSIERGDTDHECRMAAKRVLDGNV
jgi:hypothetical protein